MTYHDRDGALPSVASKFLSKKFGFMVGGGLLALVAVNDSYYQIGETERGLIYTFGKLTTQETTDIKQPGPHFKAPFIQSVRRMPVGVKEVTHESVNIYTRDSQDLDAKISYQYQIPESSLLAIARKLAGNDSVESIVDNTVMQALKASFGKMEATDVPEQRDETMISAAKNADHLLFSNWKINVSTINMPNFDFNPGYKEAIVRATQMKAEAERARQEVEKTKAEADSAFAKADGEARAIERTADAKLYETQKAAEGQERLIAVIGQENMPAYWFNEKWSGIAPQVIGGTNVSVTDIAAAIVPKGPAATQP